MTDTENKALFPVCCEKRALIIYYNPVRIRATAEIVKPRKKNGILGRI